jgi:hypothetical protein
MPLQNQVHPRHHPHHRHHPYVTTLGKVNSRNHVRLLQLLPNGRGLKNQCTTVLQPHRITLWKIKMRTMETTEMMETMEAIMNYLYRIVYCGREHHEGERVGLECTSRLGRRMRRRIVLPQRQPRHRLLDKPRPSRERRPW